jgi:heme/copper-type cytochrome/quinol oxidase subunit 2
MATVEASNEQSDRMGAWMGIAFVVLFVVGFIVFPTPSSNKAKDTAKWLAWWNDSGHRTAAIIGAYLIVLGVLAFVWFAWNLRQRLQDRDRPHDLGGLMFTFGSLFAGIALVSTLVRASIAGAKQFGKTPIPAGDFARQFDQIGFGLLLVAGALCAGVFVAVASFLARRSGALPGWLTTAGYVVAVLQLAASLFFPFILFPLWVLIASIVLLRRGSRVPEATLTAPR